MPTYLHIDLNCFFASVEQQANPFLRGKPIGIVADPTGRYVRRGVLATASYQAKAKGVKSGMPAFQAKQLCPEIILIGGDGDKYEYISNCFNNIVRRYSDDVTQFSIDEAYMEVDSVRHLLGSPTTIAHNIKQAMREELGTCITCSIGIGPNRILAKLASDLQKPDGLVEITHENKFEVLRSVPLDALAGIGPKTRAHLEALGIVDFDDLYKADDLFLKNAFGVWGINLKRVAQGHESGFFRYTHNQQKSIGHSRTVNANMETLEQLKPLLKRLSSKVGQRARKHGLVGQTVHVQWMQCVVQLLRPDAIVACIISHQGVLIPAKVKLNVRMECRSQEEVQCLHLRYCFVSRMNGLHLKCGRKCVQRVGALHPLRNLKYAVSTSWHGCIRFSQSAKLRRCRYRHQLGLTGQTCSMKNKLDCKSIYVQCCRTRRPSHTLLLPALSSSVLESDSSLGSTSSVISRLVPAV